METAETENLCFGVNVRKEIYPFSLASSYVRTAQLSIALADCLNVAQYGTTARKQSNSSLRKGQGKGRLKKGHGS